jgi:hypothetical protein
VLFAPPTPVSHLLELTHRVLDQQRDWREEFHRHYKQFLDAWRGLRDLVDCDSPERDAIRMPSHGWPETGVRELERKKQILRQRIRDFQADLQTTGQGMRRVDQSPHY